MAEAEKPKTQKSGSLKANGKLNTETAVLNMATPVCAGFGCEVVNVEWQKEGGSWFLRVFIDKADTGVDLDLCAEISHALSDVLDLADFIENNYVLEVSSPGLERPLKKAVDYQRFKGEEALLKLYSSVDGKKEFIGTLLGYGEDGVGISCEDSKTKKRTEYHFALDKISKAHLVYKF